MMQYPVIVPVPTQPRDCIVVDGKKYCEEGDVTKRDLAALLAGTVIVIAILAWAIKEADDDNWRRAGLILGVPLAGLFIWLLT